MINNKIYIQLLIASKGMQIPLQELRFPDLVKEYAVLSPDNYLDFRPMFGFNDDLLNKLNSNQQYYNLKTFAKIEKMINYGIKIYQIKDWEEIRESCRENKMESLPNLMQFIKEHILAIDDNKFYFTPQGTLAIPKNLNNTEYLKFVAQTLILGFLGINPTHASLSKVLSNQDADYSYLSTDIAQHKDLYNMSLLSEYVAVPLVTLFGWENISVDVEAFAALDLFVYPSQDMQNYNVTSLVKKSETLKVTREQLDNIIKYVNPSDISVNNNIIICRETKLSEVI